TLLFDDCADVPPNTVASGSGVYVLAMGPSLSPRGRAPVSGLRGGASGCDSAYSVAGVQFRLVRVRIDAADLADPLKARNRVAYKSFATTGAPLTTIARKPFQDPTDTPVNAHGLTDLLTTFGVRDTEVPLAVVHWTADAGIVFVDRWMVRRRLTPAS